MPITSVNARPKKRYGKRRYYSKKKSYSRRRRYGSGISQMATNTPLPQKFKATLKYNESVPIVPGLGLGRYVFNAASLWDPNYTGTGHQPMGFDQIMPMYDHYTVIASKLTVNFQYFNDTSPMIVGCYLGATVGGPTSSSEMIEQSQCKYDIIGKERSSTTLVMTYSPKKFMGISKPLSADKLQGTISANPSDGAFFQLWAQSQTGADTGTTVLCDVSIEYIAVFTEPHALAQS